MTSVDEASRYARRFLAPPSNQPLAEWIEANIVLPASASAKPGPMRLLPYQRGICEALDDPSVRWVTFLKSTRVGATALMESVMAHYTTNSPTNVLMVQPTDNAAADAAVSVERLFEASPTLRSFKPLARSTKSHKLFPGGSLKFVSAAPSNLRRIFVKVLLLDEVDGYRPTKEGSSVKLATQRTHSADDRKIFSASTPLTVPSEISDGYDTSDKRIWECRCLQCGEHSEILWPDIRWEEGQPETACWVCPKNGCVIDGKDQVRLVTDGRWRVTAPEVIDHAGFKINCLSSSLKNSRWAATVQAFLRAKCPADQQAFANLYLGEPWSPSGDALDTDDMALRAEPFGLEALPSEVLWLTCGVDVQDDRLETVVVGHDRDKGIYPLKYEVLYGRYDGDVAWQELDAYLKQTWAHPLGGTIGISAAFVDAGSGLHMPTVIDFCRTRQKRRVWASKGAESFKREPARKSKYGKSPLWILGVDSIKLDLTERINLKSGIRFSSDLSPAYFEHMAGEQLVTTFVGGREKRKFEPVKGTRHDAWDATVYAMAARHTVKSHPESRIAELTAIAAPPAEIAKAMAPPEPDFWKNRSGLSENYREWG